MHKEKRKEEKANKKSRKESTGDAEETKEEKLRKALAAEDERNHKMEGIMKLDERKRSYNSLQADNREPTEEEMEAYRMKRNRQEDPMAQFLGKR